MPGPKTDKNSRLAAIHTDLGKSTPNKVPIMPKSLPKTFKAEWGKLVRYLQEQGTWADEKSGVLETFCANLLAARAAQEAINHDGLIMEGGRCHPASAALVRHGALVNKSAHLLGLGLAKPPETPQSKKAAAANSSNWDV